MKRLVAALAATSALAIGAPASAAIIPELTAINTVAGGFQWLYEGTVASDQGLISGDRLIIYDFAGFTGTFYNPYVGLVNTSTELFSNPEGPLLPFGSGGFTDDPNLPNLVFTYVGPNVNISPDTCCTERSFAGIGAQSIYNQITTDGFSGNATINQGQVAGNQAMNFGSVEVPAVPEPATWGMMLLGFGAIGGMMRRKKAATTKARVRYNFA
jgi:hypothetical protein